MQIKILSVESDVESIVLNVKNWLSYFLKSDDAVAVRLTEESE